jgi:hypothetical protein
MKKNKISFFVHSEKWNEEGDTIKHTNPEIITPNEKYTGAYNG